MGYDGMSPLHMACLAGHVQCCRKLLQYGTVLSFVRKLSPATFEETRYFKITLAQPINI